MAGGLKAPSSLVRYSSYRSHDQYQRQRVLQKERAIVSRGAGLGLRSLPLSHKLSLAPSVAMALAHDVLISLDLTNV